MAPVAVPARDIELDAVLGRSMISTTVSISSERGLSVVRIEPPIGDRLNQCAERTGGPDPSDG
jgi:hypothetical protein